MSESSRSAAAAALTDTKEAVLETLPADPLRTQINQLREAQKKMRQEKKELSKALRNATKKQQRLRKRTRLMTDEDLVAVLLMRKDAGQTSASKSDAGPTEVPSVASSGSGSGGAHAAARGRKAESVAGHEARDEERSRSEEPPHEPDAEAGRP